MEVRNAGTAALGEEALRGRREAAGLAGGGGGRGDVLEKAARMRAGLREAGAVARGGVRVSRLAPLRKRQVTSHARHRGKVLRPRPSAACSLSDARAWQSGRLCSISSVIHASTCRNCPGFGRRRLRPPMHQHPRRRPYKASSTYMLALLE